MVFYAQSTGTVISGRADRERESQGSRKRTARQTKIDTDCANRNRGRKSRRNDTDLQRQKQTNQRGGRSEANGQKRTDRTLCSGIEREMRQTAREGAIVKQKQTVQT